MSEAPGRLRCAIVGSGLIARAHARGIAEAGQAVAWIVNPDLGSARRMAAEVGAERVGKSLDEVLGSDVDCVHLCTPPALHYAEAKAVLEAGKHLVCEKPLCLESAEAWELAELAGKKGLVAAVGFNVRGHEACILARRRLAESDLGGIVLVHGSYLQEYHALPDALSWRYRPSLAGPMRAVTEIGSHWLDLARFLTGLEIEAVSASFGHFNPERVLDGGIMRAPGMAGRAAGAAGGIQVASEDAASISLRFSNGAIGNLLISEVSHGRSNSLSIEVTGRDGSLWWNSEEPYRLHSARKGEGLCTETGAFGGGYSGTFRSLFDAVYADIGRRRRGEPVDLAHPAYPTLGDGAVNVALCSAICASANSGSAWVGIEAPPLASPGTIPAVHPETARMIERFGLVRLPVEGTLYRNVYCSECQNNDGVPAGTDMIGLYADQPRSQSNFHRLTRDEIWHALGGDPFRLILIHPDGSSEDIVMGPGVERGQRLQFVVPAGVWQAGCILPGGRYALYSCTVVPGFAGDCFEAADGAELLRLCPSRAEDIARFCPRGAAKRLPEGFTQ